jgi:TPR repeat protein
MKTSFRCGVPVAALILFFVSLAAPLRGQEADLAQLRAKAEEGNAIAQSHLGLAYAEGKAVPRDPVEAYVWLRLAADNGGTSAALGALIRQMSIDELAAGESRLDERRRTLPTVVSGLRNASPSAASGGPAAAPPARTEHRFAAMQEELSALRVDKARLTQQLAALQNSSNVSDMAADQKRTAELTARLEETRKDLAAALKANDELTARGKLEAARKDLAAALKANDELTARGKKLLDEQDALKRQLAGDASAAQRLTDLERQLQEAHKGLRAAKDSHAEMERLKQDLALLRAHNEANQRLEHQIGSDADFPRQRAAFQAMIAELKRAEADLQLQIASLTSRLAKTAPAAPAGGGSDEDLARLKDELKRASTEVEMTVRSFALLQVENEQLKIKLAQSAAAGPASVAAAAPVPTTIPAPAAAPAPATDPVPVAAPASATVQSKTP